MSDTYLIWKDEASRIPWYTVIRNGSPDTWASGHYVGGAVTMWGVRHLIRRDKRKASDTYALIRSVS